MQKYRQFLVIHLKKIPHSEQINTGLETDSGRARQKPKNHDMSRPESP